MSLRDWLNVTLMHHSDHLAFFRRTLGTRLGSKYKSYWNYICGHVINKYSRRAAFKMGFDEKKEGLGWKFAYLVRQTLHLVLFYIDLEVSQLLQSPSDQAGIFSVSYRIALFRSLLAQKQRYFCNQSMFLKIEAVLYRMNLRSNFLLKKPIQYVYLHVFSVYICWMIYNIYIKYVV